MIFYEHVEFGELFAKEVAKIMCAQDITRSSEHLILLQQFPSQEFGKSFAEEVAKTMCTQDITRARPLR